jgi:hypothetical protein
MNPRKAFEQALAKQAEQILVAVSHSIPQPGSRVKFDPNPASLLLYSGKVPRKGEEGTVVKIPLGGGSSHYMKGPGGGLVYVNWDTLGTMGVAPQDIVKMKSLRPQQLRPGDRVTLSGSSGIDSYKSGVLVTRWEVKTDGRGIPINVEGAYKPVDWKKEVAVRLDNGKLITMFKGNVVPEGDPRGLRPR